jgi:hypothetical protein
LSDSHSLPSEVQFASFFVYTPRIVQGEGDAGPKSRRLVRSIKSEAHQFSVRWNLAGFVRNGLGDALRERYFGAETTLVPMPGHAPLKDQDSRWPARELCAEFVKSGLGVQSMPLIERISCVSKAAFSSPGKRPTAHTHFESFECKAQIGVGESITVVDDVITRGATMLAAVAVLQNAYPGATIRGFSLIRTMSDVALQNVTEPVEGSIVLRGSETFRRP